MATTLSMPDLPSFRVVAPHEGLKLSDMELSDGTKMIGADGLLIPPARSYAMAVNTATRMLSSRFDEAMRDNFIAARAMRRDGFLEGLFEERILPTVNRTWQLEVDDDTDPAQSLVRDGLTKVVQSIPDFDQFKRANLDGVWFGRAGCQWSYKKDSENNDLWGIPRWDPLHGDSIQYTFDGVPAVLLDTLTTGWYSDHGASWGTGGNGDLRPTDRGGTALVLQRPYWRDRFTIHSHIRRKADYFEGELAGSVQGLGLRGQVYWLYSLRSDALTWMIAYMQAVGAMDLLVFNYPAGNDAAKRQQEANANKVIGKAAIVCPRNPTGNWPAVEQVQMNAAGMKALHDLVADYFDRHIERLFVGQSMSSGADKGTGLGGTGRADFARATKDEILVYDTTRLDSTFTYDLIRPLKKYNYPWANFPVRFKSVLPDVKAKDKVESGKIMVDMGGSIKLAEFRAAADYSKPDIGDEVIAIVIPGAPPMVTKIGSDGKPEVPPELLAGMGGGGPPPGMGGPPGMMPPPGMPPNAMGAPPMGAGGPPVQMAASGPHGAPNNVYGAGTGVGYDGGAAGGAGAGPGGVPPVNGPTMGYPGGGNTYIPGGRRFRDRRHPEDIVGFTRMSRYTRPKPIRYGEVTEDDFHRMLDENPNDHQTRMVFADWLQERNDPRAEGYRAMGVNGHHPYFFRDSRDRGGAGNSWIWHDRSHLPGNKIAFHSDLPSDWHTRIEGHTDNDGVFSYKSFDNMPRAVAEDAAAHAFSQLPQERRNELLNPPQQGEPTRASRYAKITIGAGESLMGDADFVHQVHDEQGNRIGHLWVSPMENGERLHINHVGAMGHEANSLGAGVMRDALRQLRAHYPNAKRITGTRVSGATKTNTGEDRPVEVNFSRGESAVRYAPEQLDPREQDAFEEVINNNPLESLNHFVYADWLQDHGHDDEATFRRAMGEYVKGGLPRPHGNGWPHLHILGPHGEGRYPEGVSPRALDEHSPESRWGAYHRWPTYRDMEEAFRRAFHGNLQQQRARSQQSAPPIPSARFDRASFAKYARSGACVRCDYGSAGRKLTSDELNRARRVDLVVLPSGTYGTNCGNCKWGQRSAGNVINCEHPDIKLPVTERHCCARWDATGTIHVGQQGNYRRSNPPRQQDPTQVSRYTDDGLVMYSHGAFQESIRENPHDDANWLVYADWLQENGNEPSAQRIRWWMGARNAMRQARGMGADDPKNVGKTWNESNTRKPIFAKVRAIQPEWVSRLFGVENARHALDRFHNHPDHPEVMHVVDNAHHVAEKHALGLASDDELAVARGEAVAAANTIPSHVAANHTGSRSARGAAMSAGTTALQDYAGAIAGNAAASTAMNAAHSIHLRGTNNPLGRSGYNAAQFAFEKSLDALKKYITENPAPGTPLPPVQSSRYERRNAPKGGIDYNERKYRGGQFVPGNMMLTHSARPRRPESSLPDGVPDHYREVRYADGPLATDRTTSPSAHVTEVDHTSPHHVLDSILRGVTGVPGLHPDDARARGDETADVLGRVPPSAISRLKGRLTRVHGYPQANHLANQWYDMDERETGRKTPPEERDIFGAFYDPENGAVHMGGDKHGPDFAHELGHALDTSPDRSRYELSDTDEFRWLWSRELKKGQLNDYAATDPSEGLAEFARLIYSTPNGTDIAQRQFPGTYQFFKKHGLV